MLAFPVVQLPSHSSQNFQQIQFIHFQQTPRQTRSADPLHEFHSSRPRVPFVVVNPPPPPMNPGQLQWTSKTDMELLAASS